MFSIISNYMGKSLPTACHKEKQSPFCDLPSDVMQEIFSYCSVNECLALRLVNKKIFSLAPFPSYAAFRAEFAKDTLKEIQRITNPTLSHIFKCDALNWKQAHALVDNIELVKHIKISGLEVLVHLKAEAKEQVKKGIFFNDKCIVVYASAVRILRYPFVDRKNAVQGEARVILEDNMIKIQQYLQGNLKLDAAPKQIG